MQDVDLYVRTRKATNDGARGARATRRPNPPPRIAPYARAGHHNHNQHDGTLAVARLPSRSPHCAQAGGCASLPREDGHALSAALSAAGARQGQQPRRERRTAASPRAPHFCVRDAIFAACAVTSTASESAAGMGELWEGGG